MIKAILATYDNEYAETEVKAANERLPDGKYQTRLYSIRFEEFKDNVYLKIDFDILNNEELSHRRIFYSKQVNDKSLPYIKADLELLGLVTDKISEVENQFEDVLDCVVDVKLVTGRPNAEGKDHQNVYINGLVGQDTINDTPF